MPLDQQTGYLEQGYANVAAAPLDMQLLDIQSRRTALAQSQSNLRTSNYKERERVQDDLEMDEFSRFSDDLNDRGVSGEELYSEIGGYLRKNPRASSNSNIKASITTGSELDSLANSARQAVTNKKRNVIENTLLDDQAKNLPQQMEANNVATQAKLASAKRSLETISDLKNQDITRDSLSLGAGLFSSMSNAPIEVKQKAIALFRSKAKSDDQYDREAASAILETAHGLRAASSLKKIGEFKMERHSPFILGFKGKYGTDIAGLQDPETRSETIALMGRSMKGKGASESEMRKFKEFSASVSQAARFEADAGIMEEDFYSLVNEAYELNENPDPEKQKLLNEKLDYLATRALVNSAYVQSGYDEIEESEASLREVRDEDDRLRQLQRDKLSDNLKVSSAALANEKHIWNMRMDRIKDRGDALELAGKMYEAGQYEMLDLESDAKESEFVDGILKFQSEGLPDLVGGKRNF